MRRSGRAAGTVTAALAAGLLAVGMAPGAQAAVRPAASTIGPCYLWSDSETAGGWCNGTGPNWTYVALAFCKNQIQPLGTQRWAGDRRGSYGYCSEVNSQLSSGEMFVDYNGQVECIFPIPANAGTMSPTHSCT